jgi:uncharacterized protein YecE (DUF72 family)
MMATKPKIYVGTSGWYYDHWLGRFYPEDLPKSEWFEYYARHFDTVEINNTFYHQPKPESVKRWRRLAPQNFVYTVKANRYITHIKRLKNVSAELERFFENVHLLKNKLGPILYQLPPGFHQDLGRLESFLKLLPEKHLAVFEFRHQSWYADDTYKLLQKYNAAFCIHDLSGNQSPRIVTGDSIYLRFHGTTGRYSGNYTKAALKNWAKWVKSNLKNVRSVYAYFNNDYNAYAVYNAQSLRELLPGQASPSRRVTK